MELPPRPALPALPRTPTGAFARGLPPTDSERGMPPLKSGRPLAAIHPIPKEKVYVKKEDEYFREKACGVYGCGVYGCECACPFIFVTAGFLS